MGFNAHIFVRRRGSAILFVYIVDNGLKIKKSLEKVRPYKNTQPYAIISCLHKKWMRYVKNKIQKTHKCVKV